VELYLHSPNTPSWSGAQLKHRDTFTVYLYIYLYHLQSPNTDGKDRLMIKHLNLLKYHWHDAIHPGFGRARAISAVQDVDTTNPPPLWTQGLKFLGGES
jgi:hypothetical protein